LLGVRRFPIVLEQHVIKSTCGDYIRDVWFAQGPPDRAHGLAVFLDGEHYLRDMDSLSVVQDLIDSGAIPPMSVVFISHKNGAARHQDLTCNQRYCRFIAEDVVEWARQRNSQIRNNDNLICGLSLSGLSAAYIAALYPPVFSCALCQSGSFWWFADHDVELLPTQAKFWLSVGSDETATGLSHPPGGLFQRVSQIDGVESAARRLTLLGGIVRYEEFKGGHGFAAWRKELAPALTWLVGGQSTEPGTRV
jgi:enterochelin esterase family protein